MATSGGEREERQAWIHDNTPYLYCHPATSVDIQRDEMSCHAGPRCYMNTDIQHKVKQYKPTVSFDYTDAVYIYIYIYTNGYL